MSQWSNTWQPLRSRGTHPTRRRLDNNWGSRARICPFLPLCHILQNDILGNNAWCPTWSCPLARSALSLWNWDLQFKTIQVLQQINKVFIGQQFRKWYVHRHIWIICPLIGPLGYRPPQPYHVETWISHPHVMLSILDSFPPAPQTAFPQ